MCNWSKTYFHLRSDFKWLQIHNVYGLSLCVQAWVDLRIWKTLKHHLTADFELPTLASSPVQPLPVWIRVTFFFPNEGLSSKSSPSVPSQLCYNEGFLDQCNQSVGGKNHTMTKISKDQISMQLQKGTLWLALTDITMRAVTVLAWEKPLITKKDESVWYENQKLNESPSSVIFEGLMICRFWRKWPNPCLLKRGGMQDGRRTGGKCVSAGETGALIAENWHLMDSLWCYNEGEVCQAERRCCFLCAPGM